MEREYVYVGSSLCPETQPMLKIWDLIQCINVTQNLLLALIFWEGYAQTC